jgi:hypothetical protein
MLRTNAFPVLLFALACSACAASHTPVPLVGPSKDVSALTGEWVGDYSSTQSGRSGSITFTLRAQGDSAFGDVVMIPTGLNQPLAPWRGPGMGAQPPAHSEVLTINFVRVMRDTVSGTLAPYADPQTGARLSTSFVGALKGNTIDGTYTTHLPSGETQTGRWTVQRK